MVLTFTLTLAQRARARSDAAASFLFIDGAGALFGRRRRGGELRAAVAKALVGRLFRGGGESRAAVAKARAGDLGGGVEERRRRRGVTSGRRGWTRGSGELTRP